MALLGGSGRTPSFDDGSIKLAQLRSDPGEMIAMYSFADEEPASMFRNRVDGGPCSVGAQKGGDGAYVLDVGEGFNDAFYYSFVGSGDEVGRCRVPKDVPVGTLVVTATMNGCAMNVRDSGDNMTFRHDWNGKHMSPDPGRRIWRCEASDYWNKAAVTARIREDYGPRSSAFCAYHLITIKTSSG